MRWKSYISTENACYNLLALLALFIPIYKRIVPVLIGVTILFAAYYAFKNRKLDRSKTLLPLLLLMAIYALHLVGLIQTKFPLDAQNELEYKASYFIFPLLAFLLPRLSKKEMWKIADVFTTGALLFMAFAIPFGVYRSIDHHSWAYLTYERLGVFFHPTYMAVYECLALFTLLARCKEQRYLFGEKAVHWFLITCVVVFIDLLASKAGIASVAIVIGCYVWYERHNRLPFANAAVNGSIVLGILLAGIIVLPFTFDRLKQAGKDANVQVQMASVDHEEAHSSTVLRMVTWKASLEIIANHPFGVGTGNLTPALVEKYKSWGENHAAEKNLNSHNQFLQTAAELGWVGLFLLVIFLIKMIAMALKNQNRLMVVFVALCTFNFLFESFLEVQAGIVFFGFWSMIFLKSDE